MHAASPTTLLSPPPNVSVRHHNGAVEVRLPWRSDVNFGGYLVHLGIIGLSGWLSWDSEWPSSAVGWGITLFWCYYLVYGLVNRTVVRIEPAGVQVSHGPLPGFSFGTRASGVMLSLVYIDKEVKGLTYRSRRTHYALRCGTSGTTLLSHWNYRAPLAFVKQCIEQHSLM